MRFYTVYFLLFLLFMLYVSKYVECMTNLENVLKWNFVSTHLVFKCENVWYVITYINTVICQRVGNEYGICMLFTILKNST